MSFKDVRPGQVWREYSDQDYGHIIRWEVLPGGQAFLMVRNMASLEQRVLTPDTEDTFTFQCEHMPHEKGWG